MIEFIKGQLENQFLSGGAVLMVLGALLAMSRRIPNQIYQFLHRRLVTTVDVSDQDQAFFWIQEWLAQHEYSKKTRLLTITTQKSGGNKIEEKLGPPRENGTVEEDKPEVFFSPAPGMHLLKFEGHWLLLIRSRREVQGAGYANFWRDTFDIKTFARDRGIFRRLVHEARAVAFPERDPRISVYAPNYGTWAITSNRPPRDPDSVVLKEGIMEDLLEDAETFFLSSEWYQSRGIPYQRGYLLYGPAGNGKTSFVIALASQLRRDVYLAKVNGIDDSQFRMLMTNVPKHSIVLIEDVDCFFEGRENKSKDILDINSLSFSGFLNAIDGILCSEGRLLIMTTNHKEKLDAALIRSGRIDRKIPINGATRDQARRLFMRFFDDRSRSLEFAAALPEDVFSMADLQGILLNHRDDPHSAIEDLRCPRVVASKEVA